MHLQLAFFVSSPTENTEQLLCSNCFLGRQSGKHWLQGRNVGGLVLASAMPDEGGA